MAFLLGAGIIILVLLWILFGALAGWIASIIMGTNRTQGFWADVLTGVVGGLIGGLLFRIVGIHHGGILWSLLTAVVGSIIFLLILRLARGSRRATA